VAETYRSIRNTLRYQLSNLYDFDPATHTVADEKLTGLDRWILGEFANLEREVATACDEYEFHVVYQKISQFVAVELSAIYHDVVKDRLYTDPANSERRRSTQTALHRMVSGLCQMMAPILSFTADEAWEFVPSKGEESLFLATWQPRTFERSEQERETWKDLFHLRELGLAELEKARQAKTIGKALEAKVRIIGNPEAVKKAKSNLDALRELLNVSQLDLGTDSEAAPQGVSVSVSKADGQKCERCWHWETDVGANREHPTLCGRCVKAVGETLVINGQR
jgi:isoleucyl-tRNA synthetase